MIEGKGKRLPITPGRFAANLGKVFARADRGAVGDVYRRSVEAAASAEELDFGGCGWEPNEEAGLAEALPPFRRRVLNLRGFPSPPPGKMIKIKIQN